MRAKPLSTAKDCDASDRSGTQPMDRNGSRMRRFVGRAWDEVKGSLYRNAFFIMLSSVVASGLGFFFWLIVANAYKKEDIGAAITLFQTLAFLAALGVLGQGIGLVRYLPETDEKAPLVNTALTITGVTCLVLSIVFLLGLPLWAKDFAFVIRDPLYIATIVLITMALGFAPILDQTAIAMRRADVQTWRNTIFSILKIPLALGIVVFLSGRAGVFLSLALSFGVSVVVVGYFFLPRVIPGYRPTARFEPSRVRPMMRFALGNYVSNVIGSAGTLLLPLLIYNLYGPDVGPVNAAYFYVALIVASLLYIIPGATFTSFYAEASQKNSDRRRGERKAILLTLGLLAPGIGVLWLFSRTMLTWFGDPAYAAEAVEPLRILTFASIPAFLNGILTTRVRIRKQTLPLIISSAIATAITLGLGWVLLQDPTLGIGGLAYAFVLGQAAATPYLFYVARDAFEAIPTEPVFPPTLE